MCLWQAHADDPTLPLDGELFVASQSITGSLGDPWSELTQPDAGRRYRSQVRRIVDRLRAELSREIQLAERRMEDPRITLASLSKDRRLSPLGCYIAAHRIGRPELANRFADGAAQQDRACPLYRAASLSLLPPDLYPVAGVQRSRKGSVERHPHIPAIHRDELILTCMSLPLRGSVIRNRTASGLRFKWPTSHAD